ncbi:hypothetical protein [Escherichia coli]|nr:hypothetical protein [Escherichia coli]
MDDSGDTSGAKSRQHWLFTRMTGSGRRWLLRTYSV